MISIEKKTEKEAMLKAKARARREAWENAEIEARKAYKAKKGAIPKAARDISLVACFEDASGYQFVETADTLSGRRRWFVKPSGEISAPAALTLARAYAGTDGAACPNLLDSFPGASNILATSFKPQRDSDDPFAFNIDIDYSARSSDTDPEEPWEAPPSVSVTNQSMEVSFEYDLDGFPVLNSAGGKLEATTELKIKIITVSRASLTFSPETATAAEGSINPEAVTLCGYPAAAFCAQLVSWVASPAYTAKGTKYYQQNIVFQIIVGQDDAEKPITWKFEIMDIGHYYLNSEGKQVRFKDGNDNDMAQPQKLNGSGGDGSAGDAVYLAYKRFKESSDDWPSLPSAL